jgi:hypothetical protein
MWENKCKKGAVSVNISLTQGYTVYSDQNITPVIKCNANRQHVKSMER